MADPNDLTDTIAAEVALPQASATDGQSADARPLPDVIAADKYLAAKAASRKAGAWGQTKMARAVPPDTTGRT